MLYDNKGPVWWSVINGVNYEFDMWNISQLQLDIIGLDLKLINLIFLINKLIFLSCSGNGLISTQSVYQSL